MKFSFPLVLVGALLLSTGNSGRADMLVLTLNDPNAPPYTTPEGDGFIDAVAGEAFRRAGVRLRLVKLPAERGLLNANAGIEDGDVTRIAGLEAQYPNLVRVPEKLGDWEFTAFSKNASLPATWIGLRTHAVGFVRGWKIYENQLGDAPAAFAYDDAKQLFRLLQLDRIEVALFERWIGASLLKQQNISGVVALKPPLEKREMFIYLHKKHAALAPKVAAALREIKAEGLYSKLYQEKVLSLSVTAIK